MFFSKLFGKGKEKTPSNFSVPQSRNLVLVGRSSPKRKSLWQAFCGVEKEAEEKRLSCTKMDVVFERREFDVSSGKSGALNIGESPERRALGACCTHISRGRTG